MVKQAAASKGDEDERIANEQTREKEALRDLQDRERKERTKAMTLEVADYVKMQMEAKNYKKTIHAEVKDIQGGILTQDAIEYEEVEKEKKLAKVRKDREFAVELRKQIADVAARKVTSMSREEAAINKKKMVAIMKAERDYGLNFSAVSKENALADQPE